MKKTIKVLMIVCTLFLALTLTLTACNGEEDTKKTNDETNPSDVHTHEFGEWTVTKAPSYTEEGEKVRTCSCGDKETETIEKLKEETVSLSSLECLNELETVYDNSIAQDSVYFEEDGWVYARYFDGTDNSAYFKGGKDGEEWEIWYVKDGERYLKYEREASNGKTAQTYMDITSEELEINSGNANDGFQYLEYAISLVEDSTAFECLKTVGESTIYQIKLTAGSSVENIKITVVDGAITVYDHKDYTTATYDYATKITAPNKDEYTFVQELSLTQTQNELTAALELSMAQKSASFNDGGWILSYYFDGKDTSFYFNDGEEEEEWYGKVGDRYIYFCRWIDSKGESKVYEEISKAYFDEMLQEVKEEMFLEYLYYDLLSFIEDALTFECIKTDGDDTVYQIVAADKYCVRNFTVTITDGLLARITISEDGYTYGDVTYRYDEKITLPNINEYVPE